MELSDATNGKPFTLKAKVATFAAGTEVVATGRKNRTKFEARPTGSSSTLWLLPRQVKA